VAARFDVVGGGCRWLSMMIRFLARRGTPALRLLPLLPLLNLRARRNLSCRYCSAVWAAAQRPSRRRAVMGVVQ